MKRNCNQKEFQMAAKKYQMYYIDIFMPVSAIKCRYIEGNHKLSRIMGN